MFVPFFPTLAAAFLLLLAPHGIAGANIDTDGFVMDSSTTYCEGRTAKDNGAQGFVFPNLVTNSVNRCAIIISMTPSATTIYQKANLDVTWQAQAKFGDIPGNIFQHVLSNQDGKAATVTVTPATGSQLRICKAGTNCGTVIDGTPTGSASDTGAFDAFGHKSLKAYRFNLPDVGDYILVGRLTMGGDNSLGVTSIEFISFQKIKVVAPGTPIEPSPSPTPSASSSAPKPSTSSNSTSGIGFDALNKTNPDRKSVV